MCDLTTHTHPICDAHHPQAPVLQVEKSFNLPGESSVGELVDFSITVKNEGNVDLVDVVLIDAMFQNDEGDIVQNNTPNNSMLLARSDRY